MDTDCIGASQIDGNVEQERPDLSDDCGDSGSGNAEGGKSEETEDQDRIQYDIDNAPGA